MNRFLKSSTLAIVLGLSLPLAYANASYLSNSVSVEASGSTASGSFVGATTAVASTSPTQVKYTATVIPTVRFAQADDHTLYGDYKVSYRPNASGQYFQTSSKFSSPGLKPAAGKVAYLKKAGSTTMTFVGTTVTARAVERYEAQACITRPALPKRCSAWTSWGKS